MKITKIANFFISILIISSCSQINTSSKDHYQEVKKMRHGIVPIPNEQMPEKNVIREQRPPLSSEKIERGKKIYMTNCYSCHGMDAKGNGPGSIDLKDKPKDLIKIVKEVPNFKFFMLVSRWQAKMPGWVNALSENELDDIQDYIRYLAKKNK